SIPASKAGKEEAAAVPAVPALPSVPAAATADASTVSPATATAKSNTAAAPTTDIPASANAAASPGSTASSATTAAAAIPDPPKKQPGIATEKPTGTQRDTRHFSSEAPPVPTAKARTSPLPLAPAAAPTSRSAAATPPSLIPEGLKVAVVPPRPEEKTLPSPVEKKPEPPRRDGGFGARVLASLSGSQGALAWNRGELTGSQGVRFLAWELPGKQLTALSVVYRSLGRSDSGGEGIAALVLALMADELRSEWPGNRLGIGDRVGSRSVAATARVAQIGPADLAILMEGPISDPSGLAELVRSCAAKPAFLDATFPEQRFQAVLRDLRSATRKRGLEGAVGNSSLGSEKGLLGVDLAVARNWWKTWVADAIPSIVAVGAFSRSPAPGATIPGASAPAAQAPLGRTPVPALPAMKDPTIGATATAVVFGSGPASGFGTTAVTLFASAPGMASRAILTLPADLLAGDVAILGELLSNAGVLGKERPWRAAGSTLTFAAEVRGGQDPAAWVVSSFSDSTHLVTADSVKAAKVRSLFGLFGKGEPLELALAMSGDIAAGGDGTWPFRLASEIETADASSVRRAAAILAGLVSPGIPR
ncbi:MAG: hypothetical protein WCQ50_09665, partial [Spirochaetota bacterium]